MGILWDIFVLFARVALFSWGGGPASLALMQRESVAVGWVTQEEFADAVAVGNSLPGPIAPQVSAYIGYKLAGVWGAVSAAMGTVGPTTLLMLLMVVFFFNIKDSPLVKSMLNVVRPVVVGLLLWTAYDMAYTVFAVKKLGWAAALAQGWGKLLVVGGSFGLLTYTTINPVWLVIGASLIGAALWFFKRGG